MKAALSLQEWEDTTRERITWLAAELQGNPVLGEALRARAARVVAAGWVVVG